MLSVAVSLFYSANSNAYSDVIRATIKIPVCGDNFVDSGEQCDAANMNSSTCQSRGFAGGFLLCNYDCSFNTNNCTANQNSGGGRGGGGGVYVPPTTGVIVNGRAYPGSIITLMRDAELAAKTTAGPDANFDIILNGLAPGNYMFSVIAQDSKGAYSSLYVFPASLTIGSQVKIGGIFIAPTLSINNDDLKKGDTAILFGQAAPLSQVSITINSTVTKFAKVDTDKTGAYLYSLDTSDLELGSHTAKSKAIYNSEVSGISKTIGFAVGTSTSKTPLPDNGACQNQKKGDFNCDKKINLIDFSIFLYWYKKPNSPKYLDLNKNTKIDLSDFSIFVYNWTG